MEEQVHLCSTARSSEYTPPGARGLKALGDLWPAPGLVREGERGEGRITIEGAWRLVARPYSCMRASVLPSHTVCTQLTQTQVYQSMSSSAACSTDAT